MPGKKESTSRPAGLEQMRALSHPLRACPHARTPPREKKEGRQRTLVILVRPGGPGGGTTSAGYPRRGGGIPARFETSLRDNRYC